MISNMYYLSIHIAIICLIGCAIHINAGFLVKSDEDSVSLHVDIQILSFYVHCLFRYSEVHNDT